MASDSAARDRRIKILVAIIGMVGTVAAAAIANVDNLFPERHQEFPPEIRTVDLSGEWKLENTIVTTSYPSYRGLVLGYRIFLTQHGDRLEGVGEKVSENGTLIPSTARTPITLTGKIEGRSVVAACVEEGTRRRTTCSFEWSVERAGAELEGRFSTTAASASGSSKLTRL